MKKQPIHQNLNTSFVNLGALVRYLRSLQFVGSIRVELASYEAEIVFTESKSIRAREYDHIAGRIAHGQQALQRILVRAKEPHGRIHVYKCTEGYAGHDDGSVFVDKMIMSGARELAANRGGVNMHIGANQEIILSSKASENALVLAALSEFLRIVDEALAVGNLSFCAAFRLACDGIADRFPFMKENKNAFQYRKGEIVVETEAEVAEVTSAVFAALRPIFRRLRAEAKYREIARTATDRLIEVAAARRRELVKLGLMSHIEHLLADQ